MQHSCSFLNVMQVLMFHSLAFVVGYYITRFSVSGSDRMPVARCISLETGMQVQHLVFYLQHPLAD